MERRGRSGLGDASQRTALRRTERPCKAQQTLQHIRLELDAAFEENKAVVATFGHSMCKTLEAQRRRAPHQPRASASASSKWDQLSKLISAIDTDCPRQRPAATRNLHSAGAPQNQTPVLVPVPVPMASVAMATNTSLRSVPPLIAATSERIAVAPTRSASARATQSTVVPWDPALAAASWNQWRDYSTRRRQRRQLRQRADLFRDRCLRFRCFVAWDAFVHAARSLEWRALHVQRRTGTALVLRQWIKWRGVMQRVRAHKLAMNYHTRALLRSSYTAWRRNVALQQRLRTWTHSRALDMARIVWDLWMLLVKQRRLLQLQLVQAQRWFLHRQLHRFRVRLEHCRTWRLIAQESRARWRRVWLLRCFGRWRQRVCQRRQAEVATTWHALRVGGHMFDAWTEFVTAKRAQRARSESARRHRDEVLTRQHWRRWHDVLNYERKRGECLQQLQRRLLLWSYLRRLHAFATQFDSQLVAWRQRSVKQAVWTWYVAAQHQKKRRQWTQLICSGRRKRILRDALFLHWRAAFQSRQLLRQVLSGRQLKQYQKIWSCWRRWLARKRETRQYIVRCQRRLQRLRVLRAVQRWERHCRYLARFSCGCRRARELLLHRNQTQMLRTLLAWRDAVTMRRRTNALVRAHLLHTRVWRWYDAIHYDRNERRRKSKALVRLHQLRSWRRTLTAWLTVTQARQQCRQLHALKRWKVFLLHTRRYRSLQAIARRIHLSVSMTQWHRWILRKMRLQHNAQQLTMTTAFSIKRRVLCQVWRERLLRRQRFRQTMTSVMVRQVLARKLEHWHNIVVEDRKITQAARAYHFTLARRCFNGWYRVAVVEPMSLLLDHQRNSLAKLWAVWRDSTAQARRRRQALEHARHRQLYIAVQRWRWDRTRRQQARDNQRAAVAFQRRAILTRTCKMWARFIDHKRALLVQSLAVRRMQTRTILRAWRRQRYVWECARQLAHACHRIVLQRVWNAFCLMVKRRRVAVAMWTYTGRSIRAHEVVKRWKKLVALQHGIHRRCMTLAQRVQRRRMRDALVVWLQSIAISAMIKARQAKEAIVVLRLVLGRWRIYCLCQQRQRDHDHRLVQIAFVRGWKQFHTQLKNSAFLMQQSDQVRLVHAWRRWRIEWWIRQATHRSEVQLKCSVFQQWQNCVQDQQRYRREQLRALQPSSEAVDEPDSDVAPWRRRSTDRRRSSSSSVMTFLKPEHRRKQMRSHSKLRRVFQAWYLAARTQRRQCDRKWLHSNSPHPNPRARVGLS